MCLRVLDNKSYEKIVSIPEPDEAWSKSFASCALSSTHVWLQSLWSDA